MSDGAGRGAREAASLLAGSSGGGPSFPHVTKENVQQLSYYEIFCVDPAELTIDTTALRRAYRRFSLLFHPDKDPSQEARDAFEVIKAALDTLTDTEKRSAYDAERRAARGEGAGCVSQDEARRMRQAQAEAEWAEEVLLQKESQRAAAEAARQAAALENEQAVAKMFEELTHTLNTPFSLMEAELVQDWDVDADLLEMKGREVEKLLRELADASHKGVGSRVNVISSGDASVGEKRRREAMA